ncbi:hypothetical protein PLICRDRAFT_106258 [Plicaturopsis crispa FD-325 SS-3]|nr:hypothetical protein PLICRDRAFT_106258 [Plicaturopsis crispa FD-325 SS-3]
MSGYSDLRGNDVPQGLWNASHVSPPPDFSSTAVLPIEPEQTAARPALSSIGQPIHFDFGYFAGRTVRAELIEVQKANLGRKYAKVDRRPIDPPPVVWLRLFLVFNPGTDQEYEQEVEDYNAVANLGLLCYVDLFPVPEVPQAETPATHVSAPSLRQASSSRIPGPIPYSYDLGGPSNQVYTDVQALSAVPHQIPGTEIDRDVVAHIGNYAMTESSKCTTALAGATFIQPSNVDYRGQKALMFVFSDIAVKMEGTFILRYRVFDIYSRTANGRDLPVQAECYGGCFRVYSTKDFPGLDSSTDLTKHLSRFGVRLHLREPGRKRQDQRLARSVSPPRSSTGRRVVEISRSAGASLENLPNTRRQEPLLLLPFGSADSAGEKLWY